MTPGFATAEGTLRYMARHAAAGDRGFYRTTQSLHLSSLGLGTYLGNPDEAADRGYHESVLTAVRGGINFLDTAINYRHQRSERSISSALTELFRAGETQRDELVVATKAGFLTPGAVPGFLKPDDVVGKMHSMQPDFLADQIDRSRANLGLETIDVFYLHNPETQLGFVDREEFHRRVRVAFAKLEQLVADGKIRYYGTATWEGYRCPADARNALDLPHLAELAAAEGGAQHHFRFIQLPCNLAMPEAFTNGLLDQAAELGITAVASASLLQARLSRDLPGSLVEKFPGLHTDAQCAIQFTRSTPGITTALVGMSRPAHVTENLQIAEVQPMAPEAYRELFQRA